MTGKWISRIDKPKRRPINFVEKQEYQALRRSYAGMTKYFNLPGIARDPPRLKKDIVARNEQMRRVIRQCKEKLREKIKAQFRSNTPLSQLKK